MNILFLGKGSRGEVCQKALEDAGHKLLPDFNGAELIVMAGWTEILPKKVFESVKYGAINCHGGKLPEYRGSSPLNWMIINGETEGGISIIQVDEGIDTGDILAEWRFEITLEDTIATVRDKANTLFAEWLPIVVGEIGKGIVSAMPQVDGWKLQEPAYWHHRKPRDSQIDWRRMTAKQVYNLVRASEEPYPAYVPRRDAGALAAWPSVVTARLLGENYYGIPGRVVRRIDNGVVVIAADRGVWIEADLKVGEQLF